MLFLNVLDRQKANEQTTKINLADFFWKLVEQSVSDSEKAEDSEHDISSIKVMLSQSES